MSTSAATTATATTTGARLRTSARIIGQRRLLSVSRITARAAMNPAGTNTNVDARPASSLPSATNRRTATTTYQLTEPIAMATTHGWRRYRRQTCHQPTGTSTDMIRTAAAESAWFSSGPVAAEAGGGAPECPPDRRCPECLQRPCRRRAPGSPRSTGATNTIQAVNATADSRARMEAQAASARSV